MPNYINSNPSADSARRYLDINTKELSRAQNQLSSGLLTYDPSELPAASAIGIQFTSDLQTLAQATSNATQASALVQLSAGTLQGSNEILTRMNTLAAQSNSDSVGDTERKMFDLEYQALMQQLDVNAAVEWRGTQLFKTGDGTATKNAATGAGNMTAAGNNSSGALDIGSNGNIASFLEVMGNVSGNLTEVNMTLGANNSYLTIGGENYRSALDLDASQDANTLITFTNENDATKRVVFRLGENGTPLSASTNLQSDIENVFNNFSFDQNVSNLASVPGWFAGALDLSQTTGLYNGSATFATVTATAAGNFHVKVTIGDQIFESDSGILNAPKAGEALNLTSTTNASNKISLMFDHSSDAEFSSGESDVKGRATEYQTSLRTLLGINSTTTTPASFESRSAASIPGMSATSSEGLSTGTYGLKFDSVGGVFTLTTPSGTSIVKKVGDSIVNNSIVDFGNGLILNIDDADQFDKDSSKDFTTIRYDGVSMDFQTGLRSTDLVQISFTAATADALQLNGSTVLTKAAAKNAAEKVTTAMQSMNLKIASFGSLKSQLDYVMKNLSISIQNLTSAKATFTDTDVPLSLSMAQRYQALVDVSSSVFQQTIQKEAKLAQMIQTTFR